MTVSQPIRTTRMAVYSGKAGTVRAALVSLLFLFLLPVALFADQPADKLVLHFFGSSTCGECLEIKARILDPLSNEYPEKLDIRQHDIETPEGIALVDKMEEQYGVPSSSAQTLFLPDTFLTGYQDIMGHGERMIRDYLSRPASWRTGEAKPGEDLDGLLRSKTENWGFFLGTLVAGLADGINPCAIATMIFLISFLATRKKRRSEILIIGFAYTAAVYITYFSMGLGFKQVFQGLVDNRAISQFVRWSAFAVATVIGILSFRDAFRFHRTKDAKGITLQLPTPVKLQIHRIISGNLGGTSLIVGAIVAGFLVTLLEAICTGQMYLPYILAMTQRSELRVRGIAYLAFYNLLFVLPLLVVMILAYQGLKWNDLAKTTQKNMVLLKVLFGAVMLGLALYIATAGGIRA